VYKRQSGANFIVSPSLNIEIARLCNRRKIPYLPGCLTPTEIATAEEWGVEICKIFPGNVGGPEFVSALMAPCPWTRLLPTGGGDATEENVTAWIKAGAAALGMGSKLITAQALKERHFDLIAEKVAQVVAWIKAARQK
ncbi:MAG: bifunctional 4-hydroxy-2-oxoglutarate aldolase/2-dehydro-3-deoxy-phosphogluconate aldolase, partial [Anaerolineae bacterium]|nr:bifunctional 4-hydroxy-2-oxoglutarate aldolase/2-dehydro-3-deoxy-phosphogluconate aldolase [Anaerolineae bacterium]